MTAFSPNPDAQDKALRRWASTCKSADCEVQSPAAINLGLVQTLDLHNRPVGKPIQVKHHTFTRRGEVLLRPVSYWNNSPFRAFRKKVILMNRSLV